VRSHNFIISDPIANALLQWSAWPYDHRKWLKGQLTITSTNSEAFVGWLHHRYASIELSFAGGGYIVLLHDALLCLGLLPFSPYDVII